METEYPTYEAYDLAIREHIDIAEKVIELQEEATEQLEEYTKAKYAMLINLQTRLYKEQKWLELATYIRYALTIDEIQSLGNPLNAYHSLESTQTILALGTSLTAIEKVKSEFGAHIRHVEDGSGTPAIEKDALDFDANDKPMRQTNSKRKFPRTDKRHGLSPFTRIKDNAMPDN